MAGHAEYLDGAILPQVRHQYVNWLKGKLSNVEFDAIAVRGVSGLTIGSMAAYAMDKHLIVVRKPEDRNNHSYGRDVEMPDSAQSYVIVDDLSASGKTVASIYQPLKAKGLVCRGVYLYREFIDYTTEFKATIGFDPETLEQQHLQLEIHHVSKSGERHLREDSSGPGAQPTLSGSIPAVAELRPVERDIWLDTRFERTPPKDRLYGEGFDVTAPNYNIVYGKDGRMRPIPVPYVMDWGPESGKMISWDIETTSKGDLP